MAIYIRHCAIVTDNITPLKDFYANVFDFKILSDEIEEGTFISELVGYENAKIHVVKLTDPNEMVLELLQYIFPISPKRTQKHYSNSIGQSHIAFTVTDIEQIYTLALNYGGKKISSPQVNPSNTATVCYIRDPQKNILELVQEL